MQFSARMIMAENRPVRPRTTFRESDSSSDNSLGVSSTKPLALLIPGLDGTGRFYYRQTAQLSERYRVHAWEFRLRAQFDYCDLVDELGEGTGGEEAGSIVVVGESFGGTIAMRYALAYPERVRTLVLINTFAFYSRRQLIRAGCRVAPFLHSRLVRRMKDFIVERILTAEGILPEDRLRYREIVKLVDLAAYRRRLELVATSDLRDRLEEIAAPTLLFASGRDKIVPSLAAAREMASRIPSARLFEFPRAGHALLMTPDFYLADYV